MLVEIGSDVSASVVLPPVRKEMLSVRTDREGKTIVKINSSSLGLVQECMRKAKFSLHDKWSPQSEGLPLVAGKGVHKFMEIFYSGHPEERILPKFEHLEAMTYGHQPPPTKHDLVYRAVAGMLKEAEALAPLPESDKRSLQNLVWIVHEYLKAHLEDPYVTYCDEQGPFLERTLEFVIYEDDKLKIIYFGTIDAVWRHIISNEIYLVDHKTTSSLVGYSDNASYFEKDRPNHQYSGYWMAFERVLGIKPAGFIINVLQVKAKPKRATTAGPDFPQQITMRDEDDFSELTTSTVKVVRDYLEARETGTWPMGPVSSCNLWGACTYKKVCAAPRSMQSTILNNSFKRDT